jgi:hypothetical protein
LFFTTADHLPDSFTNLYEMRIYILVSTLLLSLQAASQNLVVNPGAEDDPRGTGWTIVSAGPTTCGVAPSNSFVNWTMIPDGSGNYPAAHGGSRTFFSGCSGTTPGGPFEIYQDIDVSANAALIDAGNLTTTFSGYIQTPIATQTDAGRFIVDFMTAANVVLGTSYTTPFQSRTGGSGTGWVNYSNTRIAPAGTRKIRIRLQTTLGVIPAINAYFDDISLTTASTLPLTLISFKGESRTGHNDLEWSTSQEMNTSHFAVESSTTTREWKEVARIRAAGSSSTLLNYRFRHQTSDAVNYYRLRMVDIDGRYTVSHVIKLSRIDDGQTEIKVFPNPAAGFLTVSMSFAQKMELKILNNTGQLIRQLQLSAQNNHTINTSNLPAGFYFLQLKDRFGKTITQGFSKQ